MNEWMDEINEWINKWMKERINEWNNEWINELMNIWISNKLPADTRRRELAGYS